MYDWEAPFIWNDNMYIYGDEAWFIGGRVNALFKADLKSCQCYFITAFPDSKLNDFRVSRVGTKYGKYILCFPDRGNIIWAFDSDKNELQKIGFSNLDSQRASFRYVFHIDGKVYAIASGLMKIVEMEITDTICIKYYDLFENYRQEELESSLGEESILVDQSIYCIYWNTNLVCEFNVKTKHVKYYSIPNVKGGIATICHDGKNFWFSGWTREIYVWNKENNETQILRNFPQEFGVYEMGDMNQLNIDFTKKIFERNLFVKSINSDRSIWFIPYCSNHIIYVDKCSYEFRILDIPGEKEDITTWNRSMNYKYEVEYIIGKSYIGLYSFKNRRLIEVNIEKRSFIIKSICLRDQDKKKLWDILSLEKTVGYETKISDLHYLICGFKLQGHNMLCEMVGNKIYDATVKED